MPARIEICPQKMKILPQTGMNGNTPDTFSYFNLQKFFAHMFFNSRNTYIIPYMPRLCAIN